MVKVIKSNLLGEIDRIEGVATRCGNAFVHLGLRLYVSQEAYHSSLELWNYEQVVQKIIYAYVRS